jgi:hypothetical protein
MKARLTVPTVIAAGLVLGLGPIVSQAALAPQYDRVKQFEAVLGSEVVEALGERPIDRIIRRKNGSFAVWAGECFVSVTLNAVPPEEGVMGPTTYEVAEVSRIACR